MPYRIISPWWIDIEKKVPMRKNLATVTAHRDCSPWAHRDQNGHSQPWLSRDLACDWAVTEPWSYWRCRYWAVTSPWLSCDLAVTELWPRRDWAVTSPSHDWAVIIGPGAVTTVVTVSSQWAHRELTVTIFFSWVQLWNTNCIISFVILCRLCCCGTASWWDAAATRRKMTRCGQASKTRFRALSGVLAFNGKTRRNNSGLRVPSGGLVKTGIPIKPSLAWGPPRVAFFRR